MIATALLLFAAQAPVVPAPPAPAPEKKICCREVVLGSAMAKKVCYTPAEMKQMQHENVGRSDAARNAGGRCSGPNC